MRRLERLADRNLRPTQLTSSRETAVPTYAYTCTECGHAFDIHQSFSDAALTTCPSCDGRLRKVFSSVGVVFKGSGFYRTDSRSSSTATTAAGASNTNGNGTTSAGAKPAPSTSGSTTSSSSGSSSSTTSSSSTSTAVKPAAG